MKEYKISFWKRTYISPIDFVVDTNNFVTTAIITESQENQSDIFHVRLTDIGLHSQFGEFDIVRTNDRWQTIDIDGDELNFLKLNIIWTIESELK